MSKLNGLYLFYYSKEQLKGRKKFTKEEDLPFKRTYVLLKSENDIQEKEYTECVHTAHVEASNYTPHEDRFEDSEFVGDVENPEIKEVRVEEDNE
jgi:ApbE superfamily uncharacterized protein (UPF0280 family)